jgi:hypothetical protein
LIWRRKFRLGKILYLLARSGGMLHFLLNILFIFWPAEEFSDKVRSVHTVYACVLTILPTKVGDFIVVLAASDMFTLI